MLIQVWSLAQMLEKGIENVVKDVYPGVDVGIY
jgi:hypothetical protein